MFEINHGDTRAGFANSIFRLLWQKNNGNIDDVIKDAQPFIRYLTLHVRNIYEVIDHSIPLIAYIGYSKEDAINYFDFSKEELAIRLEDARQSCIRFYS